MIRSWAVRSPASPPPLLFFASPLSTASSSPSTTPSKHRRSAMLRSVRIAIVGDVFYISEWTEHVEIDLDQHDDWDLEEDSKALHFLQPDLVLFTGDFGNENVELVGSIRNLNFPKAAILGNHDSWNTHQFSEKKVDRVQLQLECLGEEHVGYHRLDFPMLNLSVVGGRPFSCGGNRLFRQKLLFARYGIKDMDASAKKIYGAALGTPEGHSIVLLAHNGPTGLGSEVNDICGRDWVYGGGDHGDPDLAQAIADLKNSTALRIPLVVFGHMHNQLQYSNASRKMIVVGSDNTIYLNAIVPRVKHYDGSTSGGNNCDADQPATLGSKSGSSRAFTLVEILDGRVEKISQTWVLVTSTKTAELEEETILFRNSTELSQSLQSLGLK